MFQTVDRVPGQIDSGTILRSVLLYSEVVCLAGMEESPTQVTQERAHRMVRK